jgi:predicted amidohydrolase
MQLRIAGAQSPVTRDVGANVETILRAIEFAVAEKADVLLTPEGSLSGYTHEFDPAEVSVALEEVTRRAASAGLALALSTCFVEPDGQCCNEIRFYDSDGAPLGFHTKTLCCGTLDEPTTGEINHYGVRPLRTFQLKGITVGGLICNDLWANPGCTPMPDPHLTHQLARMGARVIFHAVNGGRHPGGEMATVRLYHGSNLLMRAKASGLWIVTVDNCHPPDINCSTPCGVVRPDGEWAVRTPMRGEQLFVHTIELD